MIKLETLPGDTGAKQNTKRIGRGESSGWGKTAGKGHKGAQARSGAPKGKGFEGGQTPLMRRVPKRGFNNTRWATPVSPVNLSVLNRFEDGATVDLKTLTEGKLLPKETKRVKVLGNGTLEKKLTVVAHGFSASARAAIEKAGGTCEQVAPKEFVSKKAAE